MIILPLDNGYGLHIAINAAACNIIESGIRKTVGLQARDAVNGPRIVRGKITANDSLSVGLYRNRVHRPPVGGRWVGPGDLIIWPVGRRGIINIETRIIGAHPAPR